MVASNAISRCSGGVVRLSWPARSCAVHQVQGGKAIVLNEQLFVKASKEHFSPNSLYTPVRGLADLALTKNLFLTRSGLTDQTR